MNQAIIDPSNPFEQLIYPFEQLNSSDNILFEEDDYFIDKTTSTNIKKK